MKTKTISFPNNKRVTKQYGYILMVLKIFSLTTELLKKFLQTERTKLSTQMEILKRNLSTMRLYIISMKAKLNKLHTLMGKMCITSQMVKLKSITQMG